MNGIIYSREPFNGSYTVNDRMYRNNYSSTVKADPTNTYYRHSYSQPVHEHNHLQQRKHPNTVNERHLYMIDLEQQQQKQLQSRQRSHLSIYNFENDESISYYDRIHAQFRSNTSLNRSQNAPTFYQSREPTPVMTNGQSHQSFLSVTSHKPPRPLPQSQVCK